MKYSTKLLPASRAWQCFFCWFSREPLPQVDKGRQRSERLRSSSPLVIMARAGIIRKQKNKLPRLLWTANGRFELRKKLHRPACPQPWPQFSKGGAIVRLEEASPIRQPNYARLTEREVRAQRHHSKLVIIRATPATGVKFRLPIHEFCAKRLSPLC